ncbi:MULTISPECIES: hypothetical protein [Dethiosulfovibrio]|jgi:hypothetical protein|uniref:Single-strand binding protein/Primosomal replication protein n n=3 Tax=Dethiosulfovibrio TaxID=47054 RepID=D2Z3M4_9BACT|nr:MULTISPECIES: hypothetical protein [Dethiosulfovibrio]MEA3284699.1 hypothetical protein [Synergistota bacterium]EFC90330.1 hypothetical protein Dpep_0298 [Dethiosulfovibrio peptidovorans DSM 11002]MCF4113999.1 hypothetical protein [Dethiosulfovibrio russensis]MCF4141588.1 hypothetical protein [Dethiosulfovibrio marinus]MCF4143995.1 hypothetical protein [Dethiosulfovibrio acidaminovorans]
MERLVNDIYLSGVLHFVKGDTRGENRLGSYFEFSLKREYRDMDGSDRVDYLRMRAFDPEIIRWLEAQEENTPIWVAGELRSSLGSGRIYVLVKKVQVLNQL